MVLCIFEHFESILIFAISISVLCTVGNFFPPLCYLAPLDPFLDPPLGSLGGFLDARSGSLTVRGGRGGDSARSEEERRGKVMASSISG